MWWKPIAEYNSLACIQFLLVKSYFRSHDFHHERSSVNQREAVWKKLLSIINTIMHNKGRNLTSPHSTKKFIWSFRSSSRKGRAHGVGSSGGEVGSMGKEPVLAALSSGTPLRMTGYPSLAASPALQSPSTWGPHSVSLSQAQSPENWLALASPLAQHTA